MRCGDSRRDEHVELGPEIPCPSGGIAETHEQRLAGADCLHLVEVHEQFARIFRYRVGQHTGNQLGRTTWVGEHLQSAPELGPVLLRSDSRCDELCDVPTAVWSGQTVWS